MKNNHIIPLNFIAFEALPKWCLIMGKAAATREPLLAITRTDSENNEKASERQAYMHSIYILMVGARGRGLQWKERVCETYGREKVIRGSGRRFAGEVQLL